MIRSRQRPTRHFLISLVWQVALVFFALQTSNSVSAGRKHKDSPITLPQLFRELRHEPNEFISYHLQAMLLITGCGDRLYNMTEDAEPSAECVVIAKTTVAMTKQLSIAREMDEVTEEVADATVAEVKTTKVLKHPLELYCQRLEKAYAENPSLSAAFERLKKTVQKSSAEGLPATYAQKLFNSQDRFAVFLLRKMKVPGIASSLSNEEFRNQLNETQAYSSSHHVFAASVHVMVLKAEFGEKLQSLYDKALDDVVKEITSKKFSLYDLLLEDDKTFWFLPRLVKIFYDYIVTDDALKKELDSTAAVIGKDFEQSALDFSKF